MCSTRRRSSRSVGSLALVLGWLLVAPLTALAAADGGPSIRVLLYRGKGPIRIESAGQLASFDPARGGVRRDRKRVRSEWRIPEGDGTRVGDRRVRGSVLVRTDPSASRDGIVVVNTVGLEDYVAGVLGGEIPASWEIEALSAQAVASRSYALHERAQRSDAVWHVEATTTHQVYADSDGVAPSIREAVARTRGQVLTFERRPILAAFHSAAGGRTASAAEVWGRSIPYLVSREVTGEDDSPDTYWRASIRLDTLGRLLATAGHDVGRPVSIEILERTSSGRISKLRVNGRSGDAMMSGRALRSIVGEHTLRSTLFEVRPDAERAIFVGTGRGHGVGMSQWAAQAMAQSGRNYREILEAFYPGTRIEQRDRTSAARGTNAPPESKSAATRPSQGDRP
jgi:stage II sporulation protein D